MVKPLQIIFIGALINLQSCYFFNFFDKKKSSSQSAAPYDPNQVLGQSLGEKAGTLNEAALAEVYAAEAAAPPAAVRPDPDLFARQLLLQFRSEGSTLARLIGSMEAYRELLGGASQDFATVPQTEYDATSLLTTISVAELACVGLVAPVRWRHPGWSTILPHSVDDSASNIRYLAANITGIRESDLSADKLSRLTALLAQNEDGEIDYDSYVPVCATLALDAEALYL